VRHTSGTVRQQFSVPVRRPGPARRRRRQAPRRPSLGPARHAPAGRRAPSLHASWVVVNHQGRAGAARRALQPVDVVLDVLGRVLRPHLVRERELELAAVHPTGVVIGKRSSCPAWSMQCVCGHRSHVVDRHAVSRSWCSSCISSATQPVIPSRCISSEVLGRCRRGSALPDCPGSGFPQVGTRVAMPMFRARTRKLDSSSTSISESRRNS
jgi:hypothetical protein